MRRCPNSTAGCAASSVGTIATTVCRATFRHWTVSTAKSVGAGFARFGAEASAGLRGTGSIGGSSTFLFPGRALSTRGRRSLADSDPPREEPSAGKPHARICGGEAEWPSYPTNPNSNGWNNGPVIVTFGASDALSGVTPGTLTTPVTLSGDGANLSVSGQATDLSGNTGSVTRSGVNIDTIVPTITASVSPTPNQDGWNS